MRPPLVLTGGPAVGKTTCGRRLAEARPAAAYVDVDDVRQLVVAGAAAPWDGPEGLRQLSLGASNACALAGNLLAAGFETVIADVLWPDTERIYRRELLGCLVVHLRISLAAALERAATRPVHLTDDEFRWLHRRDLEQPPAADVVLDVDGWTIEEQAQHLEDVWRQSVRR
jgi:predicted kinase